MLQLAVRRLLAAVPVLFVVSILTFVFVSIIPGNPAREILGPDATEAQVEAMERDLGLDRPLPVQYWDWASHAMRGDLGESIYSGQSVTEAISDRLPVTLSVILAATVLAAVGGIVAGTISALRGGWLARMLDGGTLLGLAIPNFWLGLLAVEVFALSLGWFPPGGYVPFTESASGWAEALVLPAATLGFGAMAGVAKQTRESMLDTLGQDYVDALRATGLPWRTVVVKHAMRNASLPVLTMIGLVFIGSLGGVIVIEQVFVLPGVGPLAVTATNQHDLPMIQGVAIVLVLIVVVVNLAVDLAYGWLNPKVRT